MASGRERPLARGRRSFLRLALAAAALLAARRPFGLGQRAAAGPPVEPGAGDPAPGGWREARHWRKIRG